MYPTIVFLTSLFFILLLLWIFHKKQDGTFNKFLKILTIIFCVVGFGRLFLSDSFIYIINKGVFLGTYYDTTDILQTILRWGYYLNYAVLPMAIFFDSRLFKNIASYVCLPFTILSAIYFNDFMIYFLSPKGNGIHLVEWFRYVYFVLELVLAIVISVTMQIRHKHIFHIKDKREWLNFIVALPFIVVTMMPVYAPQSLFGYSKMLAVIGSTYHLSWIVISIILIFALYFLFRFTKYRTRYMLIVFLTIVLFYHFNSIFLMGITLSRLPVQLCNLAAYLLILAIPFKMTRLFQFCFLANTTGTLIALFAADFNGGALGFWNIHFVLEHTLVLIIPILAIWLRIFPRIDKKAIKYTFIGFTIYFIFCLVAGTIINGYSDITGTTVNYFFMFDLDKALSYFPTLTFAKEIYYTFGRFIVYPIVVGFVYVGFSILYLLFYLFTKFLYKIEDEQLQLRNSAIDLYEKVTKKKSKRARGFINE